MEQKLVKSILAIVTTSPELVNGGAPIFVAENKEDIQRKIFLLENILNAMAHELDEHTFVLVRH